jgi:hypothetical protein
VERGLIDEAANAPSDQDVWSVLADYLEEKGHPVATRIRELLLRGEPKREFTLSFARTNEGWSAYVARLIPGVDTCSAASFDEAMALVARAWEGEK